MASTVQQSFMTSAIQQNRMNQKIRSLTDSEMVSRGAMTATLTAEQYIALSQIEIRSASGLPGFSGDDQCLFDDKLSARLIRKDRSSKRLALREIFRMGADMATVVVSDSGSSKCVSYTVHRKLLATSSGYFAAALEGTHFVEGQTGEVKLLDFKPEIFEWFLQWMYTGCLTTTMTDRNHCSTRKLCEPTLGSMPDCEAHVDGDLRNASGQPKYFLLLELWHLADFLIAPPLANLVLSTIARLAECTNSVPTPSDTNIIYDTIRENSPVRRLVLDLFKYKKTDRLLETHRDNWHGIFLRDALIAVKRSHVDALDRHTLMPWRPRCWDDSRSCEGCRGIVRPGATVERCTISGCDKVFCCDCVQRLEAAKQFGVDHGINWAYRGDLEGCKPWSGSGICERYHEHDAEKDTCNK